jgi:hypothetical protein
MSSILECLVLGFPILYIASYERINLLLCWVPTHEVIVTLSFPLLTLVLHLYIASYERINL